VVLHEIEEPVTDQPIPKVTTETKKEQKLKARQNQKLKNVRRSFSFAKGPSHPLSSSGHGRRQPLTSRSVSTPPSKKGRPSSASASDFVSFRESSIHNISVRPMSARQNSSKVFQNGDNGAQSLKFWH